MNWISFEVEKPEENKEVLIKVVSCDDCDDDFDPRDFLFLGHFYGKDCVYVNARVDKDLEVVSLGWKIHKEHDLQDMVWYKE